MTHVWRHPKYYRELRAQARKLQAVDLKINLERVRKQYTSSKHQASSDKLTSSQASGSKLANLPPKAQASSQSLQAPGSGDQGTSEPSPYPGHKQQG